MLEEGEISDLSLLSSFSPLLPLLTFLSFQDHVKDQKESSHPSIYKQVINQKSTLQLP